MWELRLMHGLTLAGLVFALASATDTTDRRPTSGTLESYRLQSEWTAPGPRAVIYAVLPHSLKRLCELIIGQLMHPFELPKFRVEHGDEWRFEDLDFSTAKDLLEGLARRARPLRDLGRAADPLLVG